jgi:hypothetical protein
VGFFISEGTNMQAAIVNMTDATVSRGQRAWGKIKATAAEQRDLWKQVGEALLVGRRLHPSNQGFGKWCKEMGFNDIPPRTRSSAMWLAVQRSEIFSGLEAGLTHPVALQAWAKEQEQTSSLPEELLVVTVEQEQTIKLTERDAARINKTIQRARSGDQGSDIAQKHAEAFAKKHGVTPEELEEAAAAASPFTAFQFTPSKQQQLSEFQESVLDAYRVMVIEGVPKKAVIALFTNVLHQIKES